MLIEILVDVMDPFFVCLVSGVGPVWVPERCDLGGRCCMDPGRVPLRFGARVRVWGGVWESQASRPHHFTQQPCLFWKVLIRALILTASRS